MFQVLSKLVEFEDTVLKPVMAQGYNRDDAMVVAFDRFNETNLVH